MNPCNPCLKANESDYGYAVLAMTRMTACYCLQTRRRWCRARSQLNCVVNQK